MCNWESLLDVYVISRNSCICKGEGGNSYDSKRASSYIETSGFFTWITSLQ